MIPTIGVGTKFFAGQYRSGGIHVRYSRDRTIVRETKAYWVDDSGGWWSKKTGKASPRTPADFVMCDPETGRALVP